MTRRSFRLPHPLGIGVGIGVVFGIGVGFGAIVLGCGGAEIERPSTAATPATGTVLRGSPERAETRTEPARRLASGPEFDCAIARSGQLSCWLPGGAPVALTRFEHTRTLSGHASPSCAVREDGTLACFSRIDGFGGPGVVFVDQARYAWTDVAPVSQVASPCVIVADDRRVECLLPPSAAPAFFVGAQGLVQGERAPVRVRIDAAAAELAATARQVCIVDVDGALSCMRPGHAPRAIEGLPPLRTVSMGLGCGEIVCGVSRADELVCFATATQAGTVRVPSVRAVAVDGCTVCMASLEGRVACFGDDDRAPFTSGPHLVPGLEHVVELSLGPEHGCARLEDDRVLEFDPAGSPRTREIVLEAPAREQPRAAHPTEDPEHTIARLRTVVSGHRGTPYAAEALARIGDLERDRGRIEHACDAYLRVVCPPPAGTPDDGLVVLDPSDAARCTPLVEQPVPNGTIWANVGQLYFEADDLERARVSFERALAALPPDHTLVPRVAYQRGWTLYRARDLSDALEAFTPVVGTPDAALSAEALQYLSVIVAEPDWDDDGAPDTLRGLARPEVRTWLARHPELAARVMDGAAATLLDMAELADTIAIDQEIELRFPSTPEAARARARTAEARRRGGH